MRSIGTRTHQELSEKMTKYFSIEGPEALVNINQLYATIAEQVMAGFSVKIDGLGTFYPKLTTKSVKEIEDVTVDCIKRFSVGFSIDRNFQKEMDEVKLEQDRSFNLKHI